MTSLRTVIRVWFARRRQKARHRAVEAAERERRAVLRQISLKKQKRAEWRPRLRDLRDATCRSLAAHCGKEWV